MVTVNSVVKVSHNIYGVVQAYLQGGEGLTVGQTIVYTSNPSMNPISKHGIIHSERHRLWL